MRTVSWWSHSSCTHPLCSLCAGTCHCFTVAHILPPCFCFSVSPAPFARTSVKKESVGVDGVMWLQICLWACKAVLSVQLLTLYAWWDLNVTVSTLRFYDCPEAALGGHMNICAWKVLVLTVAFFLPRPQTHGKINPKAGEVAAATNDRRHGAVLRICERWMSGLFAQPVLPNYVI